MTSSKRRIIYIIEIGLFALVTFSIRLWYDQATAQITPAWVVIVFRFVLFAAVIAVAVLIHTQIDKWLKKQP